MLIDAHSHWLPDEIIANAHFFHQAWGDIETQLKMMDASGVQRAVLSYPTTDAHLKLGSISQVAHIYNDAVGEILKRYGSRFIGAAILPLDNSTDITEELKRATGELGFKAISLAAWLFRYLRLWSLSGPRKFDVRRVERQASASVHVPL